MNFTKIINDTIQPIYLYKNISCSKDAYMSVEDAIQMKTDLEQEKDILDLDIYNYFNSIVNKALATFSNAISYEPSIGTKTKDYIATDSIPGIQYPCETSNVINQSNNNYFIQNNSISEEKQTKPDKFRELLKQMADIHDAKNAAYGDSFGQSIKNYGLIAALTRISDKFHRFENLVLHPEAGKGVADESRKDTLLDMANYCIMTYLAMEDEK